MTGATALIAHRPLHGPVADRSQPSLQELFDHRYPAAAAAALSTVDVAQQSSEVGADR